MRPGTVGRAWFEAASPHLTMTGKICIALLVAALHSAARADDHGRALFEECRACHALERGGPALPGPNLAGLLGRSVGGDPAFDYSPVLGQARAEGRVWTPELLEKFLIDPEETFPGTWMTLRGIKDAKDRAALVDFLRDPQSR
jgi:cytochrome c